MDKIRISILAGGVIKVETDRVSGPNHMNAAELLKWMEAAAGGVTESVRKKEGMLDDHEHGHEHDLA